MFVAEKVEEDFKQRLSHTIRLIQSYQVEYLEIGIFGSYARGEYKSTSDIDVCVVVKEKPSRYVSGELREEADIMRVDIVFVTPDYLQSGEEPFAIQLRQDYQRIV
ncbi:MAG: nucleotidyltransferase domain-containing protein [Eubacteriales bacterium]